MNLKYQLLQMVCLPNGQVRGRYAPSPSGVQHLGNIHTALLAWLQSRLAGGEFILRMDDIDTPRVKAGSAEQIVDDIRWLGIDWDVIEGAPYIPGSDGIYIESDYLEFYEAAFRKLNEAGYLYPCICSRKEIRERVGRPNASGHYVYPGTCRKFVNASFAIEQPHLWRFKVPDETVEYRDMVMGEQSQQVAKAWGDIIVKRRNEIFAYQLVSVVDDIKMGITDVVRGVDLLDSTPGQIALFRAFGAKPPRFWHVPLKTDEQGNKLSKRDGSDSLKMLRQEGWSPEQVVGQLAFEAGLIDQNEAIGLEELLAHLLDGV